MGRKVTLEIYYDLKKDDKYVERRIGDLLGDSLNVPHEIVYGEPEDVDWVYE